MSDAQLLTLALATLPTMLVVLVGLLVNNARLNDVRDLLCAEIAKSHSELLMKFAELDGRLSRIEAHFHPS